jgi:lysozyme family protein
MILTIGSRGPAVGQLQRALGIKDDEKFGPITQEAVKAYQRSKSLRDDGKAGPITLASLGIAPLDPLAALNGLKKGTKEWYAEAYKVQGIDPGLESAVARDANTVFAGFPRYAPITAATGVPEWFIGCTHFKEASCDFRAVLHNGEKIVGTNKKTTIVPIGRGPFKTFEEAAIDALKHDGVHLNKDWSIGNALRLAERYNGTGYLRYHADENSPYLWARSTINDGNGKYVRDGVWDPNAPTNKTTGFAVLMKQLELTGRIKLAQ